MRTGRALLARRPMRGGPSLYDSASGYLTGRIVFDPITARLWTTNAPAPRLMGPGGAGDGSLLDRLLLMSQRIGPAASVTGGLSGATYVVTTTANSGAGSLRAALESSDPLWIVFDKTVFPPGSKTVVGLTNQVTVMPNKTVDGRGAGVVLTQGFLIQGIGNPNSSATTFIRYPSGVANLIWAYVDVDVVSTSINRDAFTLSYGFDLVWFHHMAITGGTDASIDVTGVALGGVNNLWGSSPPLGQVTLSWCRFGPMPTAANLALFPANGGGNRPENGKTNLIGLDPEDSAYPDNLRVMFDHCSWDGCVQRNPKIQWARVHMVNCHIRRWGYVPGVVANAAQRDYYTSIGKTAVIASHGTVATDVSHGANLLIEGCVYTPYGADEAHVLDPTWPMHFPDPRAILVDTSTLGANGGLRTLDVVMKGAATRGADVATSKVLSPDYPYPTLLADLILEAELALGSGNYQPWSPL